MEPLYIQEGEVRMNNDTDKVPANGDPVNIVVWYDYIWPWCYVGLERVDKLASEYEIAVQGRAYLLRPDTPKEGRERPQRPGDTEDELSEPLRSQAKDAGLIIRPARRTPNTLYALEATEYAQQHGKFLEFHHAAYKAFWEDRQDIGEMEILHKVGHEVGLDADDMVKSLEEGIYAK